MNVKPGLYKAKNGHVVNLESTMCRELFVSRETGYKRYYDATGKYLFSMSESDPDRVTVLSSDYDIKDEYFDRLVMQERVSGVVEVAKRYMNPYNIPHFLQEVIDKKYYD